MPAFVTPFFIIILKLQVVFWELFFCLFVCSSKSKINSLAKAEPRFFALFPSHPSFKLTQRCTYLLYEPNKRQNSPQDEEEEF